MKLSKEELAYFQRLHEKPVVRIEKDDGTVIEGRGTVWVDKKKLVIYFNNAYAFEGMLDGLICGDLLSGNGLRVNGYNRTTGRDEKLVVYYAY